jgi:hypothetical protein
MFLKNCQIGNFIEIAFAIDCINQPEGRPALAETLVESAVTAA